MKNEQKMGSISKGPLIVDGATHRSSKLLNDHNKANMTEDPTTLSTIAILRRHPMYDSLVLVKKYQPCLGGYTLEFPVSCEESGTTKPPCEQQFPSSRRSSSAENDDYILGKAYDGCGRTKLVSVYLDGDDPIYQHKLNQQNGATNNCADHHEGCELVYVPINGLLHRLDNYDQLGVSIDSRVYAFAMGLKTAERFLTSSNEKELQEAPL